MIYSSNRTKLNPSLNIENAEVLDEGFLTKLLKNAFMKKKIEKKEEEVKNPPKEKVQEKIAFNDEQEKEYKDLIQQLKKVGPKIVNSYNNDTKLINGITEALKKDLVVLNTDDPDELMKKVKVKFSFSLLEDPNLNSKYEKTIAISIFDESVYNAIEDSLDRLYEYRKGNMRTWKSKEETEYELENLEDYDDIFKKIGEDIISKLNLENLSVYCDYTDPGDPLWFDIYPKKMPDSKLLEYLCFFDEDSDKYNRIVEEAGGIIPGGISIKAIEISSKIPKQYCISKSDMQKIGDSLVQKAKKASEYIKNDKIMNSYFKSLLKIVFMSELIVNQSRYSKSSVSKKMYDLYKERYKGKDRIELDDLYKKTSSKIKIMFGSAALKRIQNAKSGKSDLSLNQLNMMINQQINDDFMIQQRLFDDQMRMADQQALDNAMQANQLVQQLQQQQNAIQMNMM